ALTILPCQLAPIQARGPKSGFCTWSLPPRHCGDSVAKADKDDVSAAAFSFSAVVAPAAPFSFSAAVPAAVRDARYTAIGSMSLEATSAPRLPAIRFTVARQPARSLVRSSDR